MRGLQLKSRDGRHVVRACSLSLGSGPQRHVCRSHTPSSSSLDFEGETESATTTLHVPVIHLRRRRSQRRRRQPRHIISVCQPHGAKRTCPALPLSWQCCAPSNANMESVLASRLSSTLPVGRPARAPPGGPLLAVVRCRLRRRQRGYSAAAAERVRLPTARRPRLPSSPGQVAYIRRRRMDDRRRRRSLRQRKTCSE